MTVVSEIVEYFDTIQLQNEAEIYVIDIPFDLYVELSLIHI